MDCEINGIIMSWLRYPFNSRKWPRDLVKIYRFLIEVLLFLGGFIKHSWKKILPFLSQKWFYFFGKKTKRNKKNKKILATMFAFSVAGIASPSFTLFGSSTTENYSNLSLSNSEASTILALKEDSEPYKGTFTSVTDYQQEITDRVTTVDGNPTRSSFILGWTDLISRNSGITDSNTNNFWGVEVPHILGQELINLEKERYDVTKSGIRVFEDRYVQRAPIGVAQKDFVIPYEIKTDTSADYAFTNEPQSADNYLLTLLNTYLNNDDKRSEFSQTLGHIMEYIVPTMTMGVQQLIDVNRDDPFHFEDLLTDPLKFLGHLYQSSFGRAISHGVPKLPADVIADLMIKKSIIDAVYTGRRDLIRLPIAMIGEAVIRGLFAGTEKKIEWEDYEVFNDFLPTSDGILKAKYNMQNSDYLDEEKTLKTLSYFRSREKYVKRFSITGLSIKMNMMEQGSIISNDVVSRHNLLRPEEPIFEDLKLITDGTKPIIGGYLIDNYRLFYKSMEISWDYEIVTTKDRFNMDNPETWYEGIDGYEPL